MFPTEIVNDLKVLHIDDTENVTIKLVTTKYKTLAKVVHPDKIGGPAEAFQELLNAYKRVVEYIENNTNDTDEVNFEKEFFMRHNIMKECSTSFVIYIQEELLEKWKEILLKHLVIHRLDTGRLILKHGQITITLYEKPKVDQRSKLHIQSKNQEMNLMFIVDNLCAYYKDVCKQNNDEISALELKQTQKCLCPKCGKVLTNKKGVKTHMLRMHINKSKKKDVESNSGLTFESRGTESNATVASEESSASSIVPFKLITDTTEYSEAVPPRRKRSKTDSFVESQF